MAKDYPVARPPPQNFCPLEPFLALKSGMAVNPGFSLCNGSRPGSPGILPGPRSDRRETQVSANRRKKIRPPSPPPPDKPKMGRPEAAICWHDVAIMASNFCPTEDIAAVVGISESTLEKRCVKDHGITFSVWANQRRSKSRNALRNMQFQTAMSGNVVMMIWLGKAMLGQTDKVIKYDSLWAREQDHKELIRAGQQAIAVLEERGAVNVQD